jgi:Domain of unknown function (DUF5134)
MNAPAWVNAALAAVMLAIAGCCAARLAIWRLRCRPAEPEADGVHVAMGIAMAGMLEPGLSPVPGTAWLAIFCAATGWFTWRSLRAPARRQRRAWQCAHPAPHAVESAAMMYMLWPAFIGDRGRVAMPGMSRHLAANPALALVLAIFMLGYLLWNADQLTARSTGPGRQHAASQVLETADRVLAPRLATCYKIVMSAAMGYMLLAML